VSSLLNRLPETVHEYLSRLIVGSYLAIVARQTLSGRLRVRTAGSKHWIYTAYTGTARSVDSTPSELAADRMAGRRCRVR
jgi:hypothetical protein